MCNMKNINKTTKKQLQLKIKQLQRKLQKLNNNKEWKKNQDLQDLIARYKCAVVNVGKEKIKINVPVVISGTIKYDCGDFPYIYPTFKFDKKAQALHALINSCDTYQEKYFREVFPKEFYHFKALSKEAEMLDKEITRFSKMFGVELYEVFDYIYDKAWK